MRSANSSDETASVAQVLDVTGMRCPLPLLKAKLVLNALPAGARLEVRATDPGSERDFAVFARQTGHQLLESSREGDVYRYVLCKKA